MRERPERLSGGLLSASNVRTAWIVMHLSPSTMRAQRLRQHGAGSCRSIFREVTVKSGDMRLILVDLRVESPEHVQTLADAADAGRDCVDAVQRAGHSLPEPSLFQKLAIWTLTRGD